MVKIVDLLNETKILDHNVYFTLNYRKHSYSILDYSLHGFLGSTQHLVEHFVSTGTCVTSSSTEKIDKQTYIFNSTSENTNSH